MGQVKSNLTYLTVWENQHHQIYIIVVKCTHEFNMSRVQVLSSILPSLPLSPSFLSSISFCLPNARDTHRTSTEELHKTTQTGNNVMLTTSFTGTLTLGSNTCPHLSLKSEPPLLAYHLKQHQSKMKHKQHLTTLVTMET